MARKQRMILAIFGGSQQRFDISGEGHTVTEVIERKCFHDSAAHSVPDVNTVIGAGRPIARHVRIGQQSLTRRKSHTNHMAAGGKKLNLLARDEIANGYASVG